MLEALIGAGSGRDVRAIITPLSAMASRRIAHETLTNAGASLAPSVQATHEALLAEPLPIRIMEA